MSDLDVVQGVAEWLGANGIGAWRNGSAYQAADVWPIYIMTQPATPDRVLSLTPYSVSDDPQFSDSVVGVQIRLRGTTDPRTALGKAEEIFDKLHGLVRTKLGLVEVLLARRASTATWGTDDHGRWERSDNYHLTIHDPSSNRS